MDTKTFVVDIIHVFAVLIILFGPYILSERHFPWLVLFIIMMFMGWCEGENNSCHLTRLADHIKGEKHEKESCMRRVYDVFGVSVSSWLINQITVAVSSFNLIYLLYKISSRYQIPVFVDRISYGIVLFYLLTWVLTTIKI